MLINLLLAIFHLVVASYLNPVIGSFKSFVLEIICQIIYVLLLHEPFKGIKHRVPHDIACQPTFSSAKSVRD